MSTNHHQNDRDDSIDVARGVAVLLMVFAHTAFFVYSGSDIVVSTALRFANTITLSLFIFISGISAAKSIHASSHRSYREHIVRLAEYCFILYFSYVAVSLVSLLTSSATSLPDQLFGKISAILLFTSPVNFTEYMFLFIALPLTSWPWYTTIRAKKFDAFYAVVITIVSYVAGFLLFQTPITEPLAPLKELIAGGSTLLRFPLLFYFPIYVLGIWWESNTSVIPIIIGVIFTLCCHMLSNIFSISAFGIDVRWPPSIGFLSMGIVCSMLIVSVVRYCVINKYIQYLYRYLAYVGKDSLDFWVSHLILLFLYQRFFGFNSTNIFFLLTSVIFVLLCSTFLASLGITNSVSYTSFGPVSILPLSSRRFRKRYVAIFIFAAFSIFFVVATTKSNTLYGSKFIVKMPEEKTIQSLTINTEKQWHIRKGVNSSPVIVRVNTVIEGNSTVPLDPALLRFYSGNSLVQTQETTNTSDGFLVQISSHQFPTGVIELRAEYVQRSQPITSNTVSITVSEPLYIAWTFDWEGWEPEKSAIPTLQDIQSTYVGIPFTHFVHPRTFTTNTISESMKQEILTYLLSQQQTNNEIALHLHMQYDFIQEVGVVPRKNNHWGLRSDEGYDVPTTEYSDAEFKQIVSHAKNVLSQKGFSNIIGYRAGGWFIRPSQLEILGSLGFLYDSSGRDKPISGAFKTIQWDLPRGVQPYKLQGIYEIPNNGASTYEQSSHELQLRIRDVYTGGILDSKKSLVFVSHPQFASKEFIKIPEVLSTLNTISEQLDSGPVIFTTVSKIYSVWNSQ